MENFDAFGKSDQGSSSMHPSDAVKMQEAMRQIQMALAMESQMDIIKSMNEKCFERCIYKPSNSALGGSSCFILFLLVS